MCEPTRQTATHPMQTPNAHRPAPLPGPSQPSLLDRLARARPAVRSDTVLALVSLFWLASANRPFLSAALHSRAFDTWADWLFAGALAGLLFAVHFLLLALVCNRWTIRPLLTVLLIASAAAIHFMSAYGVHLDPSMLRNMLRTHPGEAVELLTISLLRDLCLFGVLPAAMLWTVTLRTDPLGKAAGWRLLAIAAALLGTVALLLAIMQPFSSLMRNQRELRYLITPANWMWSLSSVLIEDSQTAAASIRPIGLDARLGERLNASSRPLVVVLVVGETARAANWGLNGYARDTTPGLRAREVINFSHVSSCGTNTEVSLPCMFAPVGRRAYDEKRIRGEESLLHVLARAGVATHWRDNQSGCKGVCRGLPQSEVRTLEEGRLCNNGRCLDEGLLHQLDTLIAPTSPASLIVLHQLGNHGPSYFRRYPSAFERFVPACREDDLARCALPDIVNAYDNALLYTDAVLSRLIDHLRQAESQYDSVMIYVSDHGESLGERGLFLHGLPYAIAPSEQTRVPMVMWLSKHAPDALQVDPDCLRARAEAPISHDHLFHTVAGLYDLQTALYEPGLDLTRACRRPGRGDAPR